MGEHICAINFTYKGVRKMKKTAKSIVAMIISIVFLATLPVSAFAYEYGAVDINTMVQKEQIGKKTLTSISAENISRIKSSKYKKLSRKTDGEKLNEILTCLGVDLDERQLEEVYSKVKLSDIGKIEASTAYLEIDENGVQTEISAEELKDTKDEKPIQKAISDTTFAHDLQEKTKENMKQQLIIIYTPHYHGTGTTPDRYVFMGFCEWLKEPTNFARRTDCIAFKSPDFRWEGYGNDAYSLIVSYHLLLMENGVATIDEDCYETFGDNDVSISVMNGVFFQYNLPNDLWSPSTYKDIKNFGFFMMGVGMVDQFSTTDVFKNVSVDFLYRHSKFAFSPSITFSWDVTGASVSIGVTPETTKCDDYPLPYTWKFKNDYDRFFR